MISILTKIKTLAVTAPEFSAENLIFAQRALNRLFIAPIPQEYIIFINLQNSFECSGCRLYGILPGNGNPLDIVNANLCAGLPDSNKKIVLGENEFDYLVFNYDCDAYQIVDKEDFEVLEEYTDLETALNHILKF